MGDTMKKIVLLCFTLLALTGCSATYNVTIDKNSVTENVIAISNDDSEYSKIKNWNGFPLPLYYDQELSNPFGDKREKESGVKYYNVENNETEKTTKANASFSLDEFSRSSLVRGCFKYFNVIKDGNIVTFSTSVGLICTFSNFNVVVDTDYKVLNSNADNVNSETNTYTWNYSSDTNKSVYLEVDLSKKYNEKETSNSNNETDITMSKQNKIAIIVILVSALLSFVVGILIYLKKKSNSLDL